MYRNVYKIAFFIYLPSVPTALIMKNNKGDSVHK